MKAYIFPACIVLLAAFGLFGSDHAAAVVIVTLAFIAVMEHVEGVRCRALLIRQRDGKMDL